MIKVEHLKTEITFISGCCGSKPTPFEFKRAKDIAKKYNLKCRRSGSGLFIGSQLEKIDYSTFINIMREFNNIFFINNYWETLLENAKNDNLHGFQIFCSI